MQLEGVLILVSAKLKIINSLLPVIKKIAVKLLYLQAKYESDNYAKVNKKIDLSSISDRIRGFILHDKDIITRRWDICMDCEFLHKQNRCKKCGCFMKVKTKISIASCPIRKWGRPDVATAT